MFTHWIPPFTRRGANGTQEAFCGAFILEKDYSSEPSCPACRSKMEADAKDLEELAAMPTDPALLVQHLDFDPTRDNVDEYLARAERTYNAERIPSQGARRALWPNGQPDGAR